MKTEGKYFKLYTKMIINIKINNCVELKPTITLIQASDNVGFFFNIMVIINWTDD